MSVENVKKFYEAVAQDEALKQKFVQLSQKYQGQPMDEEKAMALTEQEVLPMAAQMGYSFTIDDVKSYELAMQQAKMGCELSDEELQAVAGGETLLCVFCGFDVYYRTYTSGGDFCIFWGFNVNMNFTGH